MRISDWSSDVCSSDLAGRLNHRKILSPRSGQSIGERYLGTHLCTGRPRCRRPNRQGEASMTRNTDPVIKALEQSLADTFTLALTTQNYHWNVVGSNFFSLHNLFNEQYNDGFAAADESAERTRPLAHSAPGALPAHPEPTTA